MTRGRRLRRDTVLNVALSAVRTVAVVWVIRDASVTFAPEVLGVFLLARRISATLACLFQLGTSQTLLRYVSIYAADDTRKRVFVLSALAVWVAMSLSCVGLGFIFREPLSGFLFPGADAGPSLVVCTAALVAGTVASFLPYSTLLGERRVVAANILELVNASGIVLGALLWYGSAATATSVLGVQALGMAVLSVGTLVWLATGMAGGEGVEVGGMWKEAGDAFMRFGLPRGASSFLDMLLLLIGPWLLRRSPDEAGYLIVALTVLRLLQTAISPVSQIAAVVTARLRGATDRPALAGGVRMLGAGALYAGVIAVALTAPFVPYLLHIWLPSQVVGDGVAKYVPIILWAGVPYVLFQALKGVVEMHWVQPLNLISLCCAAVVQIGVTLALVPRLGLETAVSLGVVTSMTSLGALTAWWLREYLGSLADFGLFRLLGVAGIVYVSGYWASASGSRGIVVVAFACVASALVAFIRVCPPAVLKEAVEFVRNGGDGAGNSGQGGWRAHT